MTLDTAAGELAIVRVRAEDHDAVMTVLREAADWLLARGNPQWQHWHLPVGPRILRERLRDHEVYLFLRGFSPAGTVAIQWSDCETWGERGGDRLAGYIHGLAIARIVSGLSVGERILEWAVERIAAQGRRFARLDAMASNARLCRYYEDRGFVRMGTVLLAGNYSARLFERDLASTRAESGS